MSAKHIRRMRVLQEGESELKANGIDVIDASATADEDNDTTTGDEDEGADPVKLQFNPFSLIESDSDDNDANDTESGSSQSTPDGSATTMHAKQPDTAPARPCRGISSKQAKKQAKAAASAAKAASQSSGRPMVQAPPSKQNEPLKSVDENQPLLCVNVKLLKGDNELKRIFGASVLADEARGEARGRGRSHRGGPRGRAQLKRGLLVDPKPHWPPFKGGLSMSLQPGSHEDGTNRHRFQYDFSAQYQAVQVSFEEAQTSIDVGAVSALLQQMPYHADSLLTMFDLHQMMGEHSQAEEMLHMALYGFEKAWHHSFSPAAADVSMDFENPNNRSFFLALFYHVQSLGRKGLYRTALEVAKLLLALDADGDPLKMVFHLDFLAICAQDYQFIARMIAENTPTWDPLVMLPNWAFSLALAARHASQSSSDTSLGPGGLPVWGSDEEEMYDPSMQLRLAVINFPLAVQRLLARLNDQGVGKGIEWQALLREPFFAEAPDHGSAIYRHLIDIFVERHHQLWKSSELLDWLKEACKAVVAEVDSGQSMAARWAEVVALCYSPTEVDELQPLRLQDFSDDIATIPREEVEAAIRMQAADVANQQLERDLAAAQLTSETEQLRHAAGERSADSPLTAQEEALLERLGVPGFLMGIAGALSENFDPRSLGSSPHTEEEQAAMERYVHLFQQARTQAPDLHFEHRRSGQRESQGSERSQ